MFHRVLVLLTHPDFRKPLLEHALRSLAVGGELHLLNSCTTPLARHLPPPALSSPLLVEALEKEMYRCYKRLEQAREAVLDERPDLTVRVHVESGHTSESVLRLAEQLAADLLVVACCHGAKNSWQSVFGGPVEKILRRLNRPLLVLPSEPHRSLSPIGKESHDDIDTQKTGRA